MTAGGVLEGDTFTVRGGTCSDPTRKITFMFDTTTAGTCKYERTAAVKGTYTTDSTGDAIMTLSSGANTQFTGEAGNPGGCPASTSLEAKFTIETDTATTEPMYIS
jgi:hypothetical protein